MLCLVPIRPWAAQETGSLAARVGGGGACDGPDLPGVVGGERRDEASGSLWRASARRVSDVWVAIDRPCRRTPTRPARHDGGRVLPAMAPLGGVESPAVRPEPAD